MTERQVTIRLDVLDNIGNRLIELQKQRDALLAKPSVVVQLDNLGIGKLSQEALQAKNNMAAATQTSRGLGASLTTALGNANAQFQKQRDLAKFWGTSSYMHQGLTAFKSQLGGFLSGAGQGFTGWLKGAMGHLANYKNAILAAGAAVAGLAIAAGVGSLRSKNYVESVMSTSIMDRKLTNKAGAMAWVEEAQKTDWSGGRQERAGIFKDVMTNMPHVNQETGQRFTESIEKTFASDIEMWKGAGVGSASDLGKLLSSETLSDEQAKMLDSVYGIGFSRRNAQSRMERVSSDAGKLNMKEEMDKRPDLVLANRLSKIKDGFGEAMIPAVVKLLGFIIKLTDAWGKFSKSNVGQAVFAGIQKGLDIVLNYAGKIGGFIGKFFGGADKAFGKSGSFTDAIKAGLGSIFGTSSPVFKSIAFVIDFLKKIWVLTDGGNKIFKIIYTILEKVWGVINWVYAILKKIYDWLVDKIKWAAGGLKELLGVDKLDWTNLAPLIPDWSSLFPNLPDWSGIMKPLEDALASFVNWLARNFPFLGINSSKPENVWQGINGAIKPAMTEEDLEHSNEKGKEDWYAVRLKNGRVQLFAPDQADAALKAEKDKFISENKDTSDLGNLPVGGSFGPLTVDTTTKAVSTFVSQPSPASDVPADDDVSADVVASVSDQSSALTSTSFKLPMASTTIPGMAIGGSIIGNGALFAHHGEEIDKAQVVSGGKTTLERITDMFRSGGTGGANINVGPTTINLNVDKISSDIDLEKALDKAGSEFDRKLIFRLRNLLDDTGLRGIAYLRG